MIDRQYIVIKGLGSISPLGAQPAAVNAAYQDGKPATRGQMHQGQETPVAALGEASENILREIQQENRFYKSIDRTVLLAIAAARQAVTQTGWQAEPEIAVNIGSSRGATGLFEQYYDDFRAEPTRLAASASPTTTLGNISSWVAHDLAAAGPVISHSVTCSTALQAIANGWAWLQAGMARRFLAGAAEAPLTPFTLAQMRALGIYSPAEQDGYWCRPLNVENQNTFVLGEGAALFALESVGAADLPSQAVYLEAIGFGFERLKSKTGISPDGQHFQKAMRQARQQLPTPDDQIDAIVLHAPGTVVGDQAELTAIRAVFGENIPVLTSNKMLLGHTLGASAALSLEYAIWMLHHQRYLDFPYPALIQNSPLNIPVRRVMLLSAGFGGNAVALVVRKS